VTRRRATCLATSILGAIAAASAFASPADVVAATADCEAHVCSFTVTVRHADEGWNHYADAWEVLAPDGRVLATRKLEHPHVDEQPFTRELRAVPVPADVTTVRIRAHDSVSGYGGRAVTIPLAK
jgi:hypothetical protein